MHLEFFHHKINELWEDLKKDGVNTKVASFVIAHHFTNADECVMELIFEEIKYAIDDIFIFTKILDPNCNDMKIREGFKNIYLQTWRKIPKFKKLYQEFEYLKDMDNVKKFIEKLEELRGDKKCT